jgi:hypothetical protein
MTPVRRAVDSGMIPSSLTQGSHRRFKRIHDFTTPIPMKSFRNETEMNTPKKQNSPRFDPRRYPIVTRVVDGYLEVSFYGAN